MKFEVKRSNAEVKFKGQTFNITRSRLKIEVKKSYLEVEVEVLGQEVTCRGQRSSLEVKITRSSY